MALVPLFFIHVAVGKSLLEHELNDDSSPCCDHVLMRELQQHARAKCGVRGLCLIDLRGSTTWARGDAGGGGGADKSRRDSANDGDNNTSSGAAERISIAGGCGASR